MKTFEAPVAVHMWFVEGEGWARDNFYALPNNFLQMLDSGVDSILKVDLSRTDGVIRFEKPCFDGWLIGIRTTDPFCVNRKAIGRNPSILKLAYLKTRTKPTPELVENVLELLGPIRPEREGTYDFKIDVHLDEPQPVPVRPIVTNNNPSQLSHDHRNLVKLYQSVVEAKFRDISMLADEFILSLPDGTFFTKNTISKWLPNDKVNACELLNRFSFRHESRSNLVISAKNRLLISTPTLKRSNIIWLFDTSRDNPMILLHRIVESRSNWLVGSLFGNSDFTDKIHNKWNHLTQFVPKMDPALDQLLLSVAWTDL
ncbi:MAG: hypothetical protein R3B84_10815 [Zavarzinella sp.]